MSAKSLFSVEPSLRMSMASCLELSKKLFWIVLVTERAPSFSFPAFNHRDRDREIERWRDGEREEKKAHTQELVSVLLCVEGKLFLPQPKDQRTWTNRQGRTDRPKENKNLLEKGAVLNATD